MIKLIAIITFLATQAFSCEIRLPHTLILFSNSKTLTSTPFESNCPESINKFLTTLLVQNTGEIKSNHLNKVLNEELKTDVDFNRATIQISTIENVIIEKLNLTDSKFETTKLVNQDNFLIINDQEELQTICDNCDGPGYKNIKLTISEIGNQNTKTYWASTTLLKKVSQIVSLSNLSVNNLPLDAKSFTLINKFVSSNQALTLDVNLLQFYKLNRPLNAGDTLMLNFLVPITLVQRGTPVELVYEANGIKLNSFATPTQNGKINDIIVLETTNNKKISGKVIGMNKVSVNI